MNRSLLLLMLAICALPAFAQIPTDGLLMPEKTVCTGFMYQHDSWKDYWEGSVKRSNGNVGKFTGQTVMWYGVYGVTPRLNVMASLPFVANKLSAGTLMPMSGLQDAMLSAKYKVLGIKEGKNNFSAFVVGTFSTPLSKYTPDFYPVSLGTHTTNVGGRLTLNYSTELGIYVNASGGYTWRSNTKLDRPAYYTDGHYYSTDEVQMPNVADYRVDLGYHKGPLQVVASYMQMNTLGGGDIRRQDMPFVSNKMNAQQVGGLVMYYLPFPKNMAVRAMVNHTVAGRNVGQTTSVMAGLLYTIYFKKQTTETPTDNQ
jgi:hypothetical protein